MSSAKRWKGGREYPMLRGSSAFSDPDNYCTFGPSAVTLLNERALFYFLVLARLISFGALTTNLRIDGPRQNASAGTRARERSNAPARSIAPPIRYITERQLFAYLDYFAEISSLITIVAVLRGHTVTRPSGESHFFLRDSRGRPRRARTHACTHVLL